MDPRGSGDDMRLIALPHLAGSELAESIPYARSGPHVLRPTAALRDKSSGAACGRHAQCVTHGTLTGEGELDDNSRLAEVRFPIQCP